MYVHPRQSAWAPRRLRRRLRVLANSSLRLIAIGLVAAMMASYWVAAAHAKELYSDRIAAVVNGDVILMSDIEKRKKPFLRKYAALPLDIVPPGKWPTERELLDELIVRRLLDQEARKKGISLTDAQVDAGMKSLRERNGISSHELFVVYVAVNGVSYADFRDMMKEQFTLHALMQAEVHNKAPMSEEDLQKYFKEHKDDINKQYRELLAKNMTPASPSQASEPEIPTHKTVFVGGRVRLRQIVLKLPPRGNRAAMEKVMDKARTIYQDHEKGVSFATLAKKYSQGPLASSGGDLGYMRYSDMVKQMQQMVERMRKGQIAPPVTTSNGLLILYLADESGRKGKIVPVSKQEQEALKAQRKMQIERMEEQRKKQFEEILAKQDEEAKKLAEKEKKTVKDLGILSAEEMEEYLKVRNKVHLLVATQKRQARLKDWIEELKSKSLIEIKL